jgi:hypothetical protein
MVTCRPGLHPEISISRLCFLRSLLFLIQFRPDRRVLKSFFPTLLKDFRRRGLTRDVTTTFFRRPRLIASRPCSREMGSALARSGWRPRQRVFSVAQICNLSVSLGMHSSCDDFLGGQGGRKFFGAGFLSGHQGSENRATGLSHQVAMSMRQFAEKTVGAQQTQFASHGGGAAAGRRFVPGLTGVEQPLEIAVAQAGNGPLASTERAQ